MKYDQIYFDGQWVRGQSTDKISVENPVTGEEITKVVACHEEDVNRAVESSRKAFLLWREKSLEERIAPMEKFYDELKKIEDDLVERVEEELGVNKGLAYGNHVHGSIESVKTFIKIAREYPWVEERKDGDIYKEPYGVVGAMTPWNYPMGQIMKKIVPAVLGGNTVVLKPSQKTPLTAYWITKAWDRAGFPKGILNLVPGRGSQVGNCLASHKDVALISFTGSTKGGLEVYELASRNGKKVILEMGGKSPAILLHRDYGKKAVQSILNRLFENVGQTCSAWSRFLVPKKDLDFIKELLIEEAKSYEFGDPRRGDHIIGPLCGKDQFDKVRHFVESGVRSGARMVYGKKELPYEGNYKIEPVIFFDVKNDMEISQEEIFGPVLSVISYDDVDEAIEIANDTVYGLSAAVFGPEKEALKVAKKIDAGEVSINGYMSSSNLPFGGYKLSGLGREGGDYGFEEFLQVKAIHWNK
ncbi:MAG: aldehyde dehydrogenase family protein [Tissierellia bacterium]|nr:aldehyde dehydrogenase family protein [Tissierellia bacterium]